MLRIAVRVRQGVWACVWAVVLASCQGSGGGSPSTADRASGSAAAGDPWARQGDDRDDGIGGFDLQRGLAAIAENLAKPGPYEAPTQSSGFDAAKQHWGVLALSGDVVERQALSLTGGQGTELAVLTARLRELATQDELAGLILRIGGMSISLPDTIELRAAIHDLRKAGKTVACHAEDADNASYVVLAACDRIGLAPLGDVEITGPTLLPIHVKSLLDKLGIRADFLHVGAYKGAAEPLTHDAPSRQTEETYAAILDRRYLTMVEVIAASRKLSPATVKELIDTGLFSAEDAREARLIDDVGSFEAFRREVTRDGPWTRLELAPEATGQIAMAMSLWRFLGALPPERPTGDHVAVVYALGDIIDGTGDGVLGARAQIASGTLVAALRAIADDDAVKAVVLRIDSGGGSAQASELIWRAVSELAARKPVIASMSDVAASGGYYIACGATKIFALDDTLTGSIGVVGGKLAPREALARLGVRAFPMGRGKRATMAASLGPWTDDERAVIRRSMEAVYRTFVDRVAAGRRKKPDEVHAIAQGRVWTGSKARELGLVDEIGGLDAALAEARKLAKVDPEVGLEIYPPAPTLHDVLAGFGQVRAPAGIASDTTRAALAALDPAVAAATEHLVKLVLSFRSSTIQAVAMLPVMP
jgi:protease IV